MDKKYRAKPPACKIRKNDIKETGLILLAFGLVTICAFFLPTRAWIILLAIVFIVCGIRLIK